MCRLLHRPVVKRYPSRTEAGWVKGLPLYEQDGIAAKNLGGEVWQMSAAREMTLTGCARGVVAEMHGLPASGQRSVDDQKGAARFEQLSVSELNPMIGFYPMSVSELNPMIWFYPMSIKDVNLMIGFCPMSIKEVNPMIGFRPMSVKEVNPMTGFRSMASLHFEKFKKRRAAA